MRTPREIYAQYRIMPPLQMHQLRVTAVGKLLCEHFTERVDERTVVTACLFHDMGNIIKFDLTKFPDFVAPEGLEHWSKVKEDFEKKYGYDQHAATLMIARELGLPVPVLECIDSIAFSKAELTLEQGSWEERICEYADSRVSPHGIIPLEDRLREARLRYIERQQGKGRYDIALVPEDRFEVILKAEREMEKRIIEHAGIAASDINDAAAAPIIEKLWDYPVL